MRIISKPLFRDFYDGAQGLGQDRSLIFMRKVEMHEAGHNTTLPEKLSFFKDFLQGKVPQGKTVTLHAGCTLSISYCVALFVGKVYPLVQVRLAYFNRQPDVVEHFYHYAGLAAFCASHGHDLEKDKNQGGRHKWPPKKDNKDKGFFALTGNDSLMAQALELNLPIVIYRRLVSYGMLDQGSKSYEINGQLSKIDFARQMGPPQVYQELSMFLGNVTTPEPVMIPITDKDRHQQHGFDAYSFKKLPEIKKRSRA